MLAMVENVWWISCHEAFKNETGDSTMYYLSCSITGALCYLDTYGKLPGTLALLAVLSLSVPTLN